MSLVIDASIALSWCFHDETSNLAERALDQIADDGGWVPNLWRLEVANAFRTAIRRSRMSPAQRDQAIEDLSGLAIAVDAETDAFAWTTTTALADRFSLTIYDAAYLELAVRRGLPLATLDAGLAKAAQALDLAYEG